MSIIRQRTKNLIFAGIFGLIIGLAVGSGLYIYQSNQLKQINLTHQEELNALQIELEAKQIETIGILGASRPIKAGEPINETMLMELNCPVDILPEGAFTTSEGLLGKTALTDIPINTVLIPSLLQRELLISENTKMREFNQIDLPQELNKGDLIDLRIAFPTGEDFVVLSQKQVYGYAYAQTDNETDQITMAMNEEELLRLTSSYVDQTLFGARLYAVIYQYPLESPDSALSYPVNMAVLGEMAQNPNMEGTLAPEKVAGYRKILDLNLMEFFDEDGTKFANMPEIRLPSATTQAAINTQPVEVVEPQPVTEPIQTESNVDVKKEGF